MATNQFFREAADHFNRNQYQKGLAKINKCLKFHPQNPTLLINRALFYSQMGNIDKAIQELQNCILLDYQNYIPYFNLFSLKVRKNQLEGAFKDLCCSLSCLYLTRARFRKREQDAKQAIKYSQNNLEAHVLRGMILLQGKRLKQSLNELDWAYEIDPYVPTLNKIREIVRKKMGLKDQNEQRKRVNRKSPIKRLICSYEGQEQDLMLQIKMKMSQFNSIYNDLNEQNGLIAHRVPRTYLPQEIEKMLVDNDLKEEIREIYELKFNEDNADGAGIYQMKDQYRVHNQIQFQQRLKSEGAGHSNYSQQLSDGSIYNEELRNDSLIDQADPDDMKQISQMASKFQHQITSQNENSVQNQSEFNHSFNQYLVVDEYPQLPNRGQDSLSSVEPSNSVLSQSKRLEQNTVSEVSSKMSEQTIILYPMSHQLYGRFRIQKLQIDNPTYISSYFLDQNQYSDFLPSRQFYCVCTYFKQKPGYKVTTCDRDLYFNSDSKKLQCEWGETFKQVLLMNEPEQIFVKIYCKNNNSYNDDLIGVGNKLITSSGSIIFEILSPKDDQYKLGELHMKLYLIKK